MAKATTEQILDVAEQHFALYGYEGTTLRGIIKDAGVNVAAIAYHFGDKSDLYMAVMERFAVPVVQLQRERLAELSKKSSFTMRDVLLAFYEPPILLIHNMGSKGEVLSLFLGRAQTEPDPVYSLIDAQYAVCRNDFITAFRKLVPALNDAEYQWRFEFMLSLIVAFLTRQKMIRRRYSKAKDWNPVEVIDRLIGFAEPGMAAR
jgi:AcrR family transcriptional regulator